MRVLKSLTFAIVSSAVALVIASNLPYHDKAPVLIFFVIAILATAWFWGLLAGLFALVVSLCAALWLIVCHFSDSSALEVGQFIRLGNLFAVALAGVFVVVRLRQVLDHNALLLAKERATRDERESLISELQAASERLHHTQKAAQAWNWEIRTENSQLQLYRDPNSPLSAQRNPVIPLDEWLKSTVHPADLEWVGAEVRRSCAEESTLDVEFRLLWKDGKYRWVHSRGSHIGNRLLGVVMDVTTHKTAEENLRRSEERFEALAEATFEGIAITESEKILDANQQMAKMVGYAPEEIVGLNILDLIAIEHRDKVRKHLAESGGRIEYEMLHKDGSRVLVEARGRAVTYQQRNVRVTSIRDISEQKQNEQAIAGLNQDLQRRIAELQTIFETVPIGLAIADTPNGTHIQGNPASEQLVGVPHGAELSLSGACEPLYRVFQDGRQLKVEELPMQRAVRGENVIGQILEVTRPDGKIITMHASAAPLFDEHQRPRGAVGAFVDLTEQKRAEEGARRWERLFNQAEFGIAIVNAKDNTFVAVNDAFATQRGYTPEEIVGRAVFDIYPAEFSDETKNNIRDIDETGHKTFEAVHLRKDGTSFPVLVGVTVIRDSHGTPLSRVAYSINITEHKKVEQELRQSREHLRAMAEALPHIVWSCDAQGRFDYVSQRWFHYTGLTREATYSPLAYLMPIHPDDRDAAEIVWKAALDSGTESSTELRLRRSRDDDYRWHAIRAVPVRNTEGNVVRWFGTMTDIEDNKRAQATLIQNEKLASTGRMAATIAHEINNPLAAATNAIYLIGMDKSLSVASRELLSLADSELRHAAQITRQTLGFYREQGLPAAVELSVTADVLLSLYRKRITGKNIQVERRYHAAPAALVIEGEIRQVIANLLANSIDATPSGGMIYLRTGLCTGYATITVADTGTGIPRANLKRIFEAFFTTKEKVGTGLGLWISREIVAKHHGNIRVRSSVGKGTVFRIFLPVAGKAVDDTATKEWMTVK